MDPINGSSIGVYRSTMTKGFSWSVAGPNGMTFGSAPTEAEAWEKAREYHAALEATNAALRRAQGEG